VSPLRRRRAPARLVHLTSHHLGIVMHRVSLPAAARWALAAAVLTALAAAQCPVGQYLDTGVCVNCAPGTYKTVVRRRGSGV